MSDLLDYERLRTAGRQPRLHGNGFLQLDLDGGSRLNVWHPDFEGLAQAVRTSIHDHRFSFHSEIILGTQVHIEYALVPDGGTHFLVTPVGRLGTEDTKLELMDDAPDSVGFVATGGRHVPAGSAYDFELGRFHDTVPVGVCATIMTKTDVCKSHSVRIGVPFDMEPDNDFDRELVGAARLWPYVALVCWAVAL